MNDGIDPDLCSLSYVSVDQMAEVVAQFGRGAIMAKINIELAYRLIPVHPHDRPLQAMPWKGKVYIDAMLSFGLRSAPKLFNVVADALEWCVRTKGARVQLIFHYFDDFLVLGAPDSPQCAQGMAILAHSSYPIHLQSQKQCCTALRHTWQTRDSRHRPLNHTLRG